MSDSPATLSGGKFCEKCGRAPMACVCGARSELPARAAYPDTSWTFCSCCDLPIDVCPRRAPTSDGTPDKPLRIGIVVPEGYRAEQALKKIAEIWDDFGTYTFEADVYLDNIGEIIESWRAGE